MNHDKSVMQTLTLISQFGINMLVPIFLCSFAGIWLDDKLGTDFIMIILFFVGAVAGGYNVYRLSKRHMNNKNPEAPYLHGASTHNDKNKESK